MPFLVGNFKTILAKLLQKDCKLFSTILDKLLTRSTLYFMQATTSKQM